jgi:hypothetical protein
MHSVLLECISGMCIPFLLMHVTQKMIKLQNQQPIQHRNAKPTLRYQLVGWIANEHIVRVCLWTSDKGKKMDRFVTENHNAINLRQKNSTLSISTKDFAGTLNVKGYFPGFSNAGRWMQRSSHLSVEFIA